MQQFNSHSSSRIFIYLHVVSIICSKLNYIKNALKIIIPSSKNRSNVNAENQSNPVMTNSNRAHNSLDFIT